MANARSFDRASLSGNPVGRPRTAAPEPSKAASALIAARNWQAKQAAGIGSGSGGRSRSIQSGAEISAARGAYRAERRFDNETGFFSPNSAAAGGSGTSPKNPWS
jgi:hypothetical protein